MRGNLQDLGFLTLSSPPRCPPRTRTLALAPKTSELARVNRADPGAPTNVRPVGERVAWGGWQGGGRKRRQLEREIFRFLCDHNNKKLIVETKVTLVFVSKRDLYPPSTYVLWLNSFRNPVKALPPPTGPAPRPVLPLCRVLQTESRGRSNGKNTRRWKTPRGPKNGRASPVNFPLPS